jgi:hypothetical protein
VGLAGGVHRAGAVFATMSADFQVVGNPLATFVIAQNDRVLGMV